MVTYSIGQRDRRFNEAKVSLLPGGRAGGAGQCDPITFSIRGHTEKPLLGTSFAAQIERLAGVRR